jgi:hypothetical protein
MCSQAPAGRPPSTRSPAQLELSQLSAAVLRTAAACRGVRHSQQATGCPATISLVAVFVVRSNFLIANLASELHLPPGQVRAALAAVVRRAGFIPQAEVLIASDQAEVELGVADRTTERPPPSWQEQRGRAEVWNKVS